MTFGANLALPTNSIRLPLFSGRSRGFVLSSNRCDIFTYHVGAGLSDRSAVPAFLSFWGKAQPRPDAACSWHPAAFHALDVAAVASVWLTDEPRRLQTVIRETGWTEESWAGMTVFLLALHDIGKFSRPFQAKVPEHWPAVLGSRPDLADPGHDTLGHALLTDPDRSWALLERLFPDWTPETLHPLLRAVTGHHGRPPADFALSERLLCKTCRTAAASFFDDAADLLAPSALPLPRKGAARRRAVATTTWWLAGITVLADWVGSSQRWFPYSRPEETPDLASYWPLALSRAERAVHEAGLRAASTAPVQGFGDLFPEIASPAPVQALAERISLPNGPVCVLVEDVTGGGKTEAALLLAHRLIASGRASGVFVALPTMATADSMFARVAKSYRRLFAPEATPSLALAHGQAALNSGFTSIILADIVAAETAGADAADQPASAQCTAWLADDRRRVLLAQVGVGTIDQALLAVLPARHAPLRLHGLIGKVLIVDEAHAYDPFMGEELARLLLFHAALGGSAVVLSATLPHGKRTTLLGAFADGLGVDAPAPQSQAYPLVSVLGREGLLETPAATNAAPLALRPGLARTVAVRRLDGPEAAVVALVAASRNGACAVWVRNTVDDVLAAAAMVREAGVEPILFHARFAMGDRLAIQGRVLGCFDKRSGPAERAPNGCGRILVATQVVEQSLDLDFDVMVTDLAPIDLLIQRAGRLWRHPDRDKVRPVGMVRELLVISPPPIDDAPAAWATGPLGGTRFVYRPDMLWRSARALFAAGTIETPGGVRDLIEAVYGEEAPPVPPGLAMAETKGEGKALGDRAVALSQVLDFAPAYRRDDGAWESDSRVATRLSDVRTVVRLARWHDGQLQPWYPDADPRRAWALSELSLRGMVAMGETLLPAQGAAVDRLRAEWPVWQRDMPVIALAKADDGWYGRTVRGERGADVLYDALHGWRWADS